MNYFGLTYAEKVTETLLRISQPMKIESLPLMLLVKAGYIAFC